MGKNDNKELNAILAQLKKSYSGNENIDNSASDEFEDDFQKMLSNYFSDEDSDKDIYKFTATDTADSENITLESDYSLADFEDFVIEAMPEEELTAEETVLEEISEEKLAEEEIIEDNDEIIFEEPVAEMVTEKETAIDEIIEEQPIEEDIIYEEPAAATIQADLDDKEIVDDVFAAMFHTSALKKTAYEELELDLNEKSEPNNTHIQHISRMFDLDAAEDEYSESSDVMDMPRESDAYEFEADDVIIVESSEGCVSEPQTPSTEEELILDEPSLVHSISYESVSAPKETIDDIIGDMDIDGDEEITLDISAILPEASDEDIEDAISEVKSDDTEQIYMSDPLQGHLSDAAFVSYKIADDEVNFDIDAEESELDDEEISLLIDFGYDDEAEAEVGRERTNEIKRRSGIDLPDGNKIYGYCGEEYTSRDQDAHIKEKYSKDKKDLLIKTAVTFSLALILFFMALVACFGADVNYLLYSIIEILILGVVSVIGLAELKRGVIGLFKLDPNFNSVSVVIVACTVIYNLFSIIYVSVTGATALGGVLLPCGFFAASYVFSMILSEYFECLAESNSFDVISGAGEIYTAEKLNNIKNEIDSPNKQTGKGLILGDFSERHTFDVRRTSVPSAYFHKMSLKQNRLGGSFYLVGGILVIAFIMGFVALIKEGSLASATYSSVAIILMGMPMSFSFVKSLPKLSASITLKEKNCAIVGDNSSDEYSYADTLIFDDECAIEIVKKIEIRPQMNSDVASAMRITARAFRAIGGPISKVVSDKITDDNNNPPTISVLSLRDNGIEFYMDSSVYMLIGDAAFMSSHGIRVSSDRDAQVSSDFSKYSNIVYIAIDGVPRLGYIINSRISDAFAALVTELDKNGIKVAVSSYDPTVNDYYFEQNKISGASTITAYKPEHFYDRRAASVADGGIFSSDDPKNIIYPLIEAKKLNRARKINRFINYALSIIGCIVSVLYVIFVLFEKTANNLNFTTLLVIILLQSVSILSVVFNSFDLKKKVSKK